MNNFENAANGDRQMDDRSGQGETPTTFGARLDRVGGTAEHAWNSTRDSISELRDRLDVGGRVDRHPYGMIAAALGVGYVLGGGIFSPLTGRMVGLALRMALRAAAIPFIKEEIMTLVDVATGASEDDESAGGAGSSRRRASRKQSPNTNQGR